MYIIERLPCRPSECFHLHPLAVYDAPLVPSFPYFFNQRDHITNTDITDMKALIHEKLSEDIIGAAMVVLNELDVDAEPGIGLAVVDFREEAARIAEPPGRQDHDAGQFRLHDLHH